MSCDGMRRLSARPPPRVATYTLPAAATTSAGDGIGRPSIALMMPGYAGRRDRHARGRLEPAAAARSVGPVALGPDPRARAHRARRLADVRAAGRALGRRQARALRRAAGR